MAHQAWRISYSDHNPPRRLWTPNATPPRPELTTLIWLGPKYPYFFPLSRIRTLLKKETESNYKENAPDAIDASGVNVDVPFTYTTKLNRQKEIINWITDAQTTVNITSACTALMFGARKYNQVKIPLDGGFPAFLTTGFQIDTFPDDVACPPAGLYWKLRPDIFKTLSTGGGLHPPQEAYISLETYNSIVVNGHPRPMVWAAINHRLPIRNEDAQVAWMVCFDVPGWRESVIWTRFYDQSTLACEKESEKTRRTNPIMNLTIVHTGLGRLTYQELQTVFTAAEVGSRQTCQVLAVPPAEGYQLVGRSPFNDYDTYISNADHNNYQIARGSYPQPNNLHGQGQLLLYHIPNQPQQTVHVSSKHIINAAQERSNLPNDLKDQGRIMGGSATVIASRFAWAGAAARVGNAGHDPTWPATNNMPAEWLHRCAFSWGGLDDPQGTYDSSDYRSSQVNTNLIFGSSETNSLMTRFEKSWQMLFRKEHKLRVLAGDPNPIFRGNLTTRITPLLGQPWLTHSMSYELQLRDESLLLGPDRALFNTTFYPFHRPLFTAVEAEADRGILALLWFQATNQQDIDAEDMGEADDIDG